MSSSPSKKSRRNLRRIQSATPSRKDVDSSTTTPKKKGSDHRRRNSSGDKHQVVSSLKDDKSTRKHGKKSHHKKGNSSSKSPSKTKAKRSHTTHHKKRKKTKELSPPEPVVLPLEEKATLQNGATDETPLVIFWAPNSPPPNAVVVFLQVANIPYRSIEFQWKDTPLRENRTNPDFWKLNPNRELPTLVDDQFVLFESHAMLRYLAEKYGEEKFYPSEPLLRAKVNAALDWNLAHLRQCYHTVVHSIMGQRAELAADYWGSNNHSLAHLPNGVFSTISRFETNWLSEGKFVAGAAVPTIADVALFTDFTFAYSLLHFDHVLLPELYPKLHAWIDKMRAYLESSSQFALYTKIQETLAAYFPSPPEMENVHLPWLDYKYPGMSTAEEAVFRASLGIQEPFLRPGQKAPDAWEDSSESEEAQPVEEKVSSGKDSKGRKKKHTKGKKSENKGEKYSENASGSGASTGEDVVPEESPEVSPAQKPVEESPVEETTELEASEPDQVPVVQAKVVVPPVKTEAIPAAKPSGVKMMSPREDELAAQRAKVAAMLANLDKLSSQQQADVTRSREGNTAAQRAATSSQLSALDAFANSSRSPAPAPTPEPEPTPVPAPVEIEEESSEETEEEVDDPEPLAMDFIAHDLWEGRVRQRELDRQRRKVEKINKKRGIISPSKQPKEDVAPEQATRPVFANIVEEELWKEAQRLKAIEQERLALENEALEKGLSVPSRINLYLGDSDDEDPNINEKNDTKPEFASVIEQAQWEEQQRLKERDEERKAASAAKKPTNAAIYSYQGTKINKTVAPVKRAPVSTKGNAFQERLRKLREAEAEKQRAANERLEAEARRKQESEERYRLKQIEAARKASENRGMNQASSPTKSPAPAVISSAPIDPMEEIAAYKAAIKGSGGSLGVGDYE